MLDESRNHCSQLNLVPWVFDAVDGGLTGVCSSVTAVRPCSTNLLPVLGDLDTGRPFNCGTIRLPPLWVVEDPLLDNPEELSCSGRVMVASGEMGLESALLLLDPRECPLLLAPTGLIPCSPEETVPKPWLFLGVKGLMLLLSLLFVSGGE